MINISCVCCACVCACVLPHFDKASPLVYIACWSLLGKSLTQLLKSVDGREFQIRTSFCFSLLAVVGGAGWSILVDISDHIFSIQLKSGDLAGHFPSFPDEMKPGTLDCNHVFR